MFIVFICVKNIIILSKTVVIKILSVDNILVHKMGIRENKL